MTTVALTVNSAAVAASLSHVLVDVFIGLFGAGKEMPPAQAGLVFALAALYGWWAVALAAAALGERGATLGLVLLAALWAFLANGVGGLVGCAPPCANAFPWQDVTHLTSLVLGGAAAYTGWAAYRAQGGPLRVRFPATAVALLAVVAVFMGLSLRV